MRQSSVVLDVPVNSGDVSMVNQSQCSQISVYQEFMAKTLQDKYADLNGQMDTIVRDANSEIGGVFSSAQLSDHI